MHIFIAGYARIFKFFLELKVLPFKAISLAYKRDVCKFFCEITMITCEITGGWCGASIP